MSQIGEDNGYASYSFIDELCLCAGPTSVGIGQQDGGGFGHQAGHQRAKIQEYGDLFIYSSKYIQLTKPGIRGNLRMGSVAIVNF